MAMQRRYNVMAPLFELDDSIGATLLTTNKYPLL